MPKGHLDLTSFRTIIHDWFDERKFVEACWGGTLEEQAAARHESFLGKIKQVITILKSMEKDTDVLSEALHMWFLLDRRNFLGTIEQDREFREDLLYMLIGDYFHGQGYQTFASPRM
jgi:hypothetical protein